MNQASNHHESLPASSPQTANDAAAELFTLRDFVRYAVTLFGRANLHYGHGTDNAFDEAVYIVLEYLSLPIDTLDPYLDARLTAKERSGLATLIHARAETRKPAAYLLNKAYIQGMPFYVDERVIVPRSFIAEILAKEDGFSQVRDYGAVTRVLDLCTGSGCLAILAATVFPNAEIDAVDLSESAVAVARKNVADYGLEDRVRIFHGDLFAPLDAGARYDLILTNPPYVDADGMASLPPEFRHEPAMALGSGEDGLDITRRILSEAGDRLTPGGGLLCEVGRCGPDLENAYPSVPFLWVDTENSNGEVFWLKKKDLP